jgi:hypothetical protein
MNRRLELMILATLGWWSPLFTSTFAPLAVHVFRLNGPATAR